VKSTLETLSPTRVRLDVKVPYSELGEYVDAAYKKVGASVTIPGFRKGKVPNAMIDQRVVGRPTVDAIDFVDNEKLDFSVEVNVRPDVTLPDFSKIEISVDNVEVSDTDIDEQIDELRARFGILNTVERATANGDFVTIDLTARIDGAEIDGGKANEISYEVGSNKMIDNLDEALVGMSAGDTKTFTSQLVGQKDGESGEIDIVLKAVKERELPALDDSFAKLASEFDTVAQLRSDFTERLSRVKKMEQGAQARDLLVEKLLADLDIPVPDDIVLEEVNDHLEGEGRTEDAEHRAEVDGQVRASIKSDFLFDSIVKAEEVQVNEIELTEYLIRMSQRYGMGPEQFAQELQKAGQISQVVAEVTRAKALASVLARITVLDKSGNKVELEALRPQEAPDAPVTE
jgi:trigger factor